MGTTQKRRGYAVDANWGEGFSSRSDVFLERVIRTFASANAIPHTSACPQFID
jgi:hypothetical protein